MPLKYHVPLFYGLFQYVQINLATVELFRIESAIEKSFMPDSPIDGLVPTYAREYICRCERLWKTILSNQTGISIIAANGIVPLIISMSTLSLLVRLISFHNKFNAGIYISLYKLNLLLYTYHVS